MTAKKSCGIKYNKAKQPSGIKKVSGGCFFELRIRELTASVKIFFHQGFSEKSRINTCTELPVNDKMILFTDS